MKVDTTGMKKMEIIIHNKLNIFGRGTVFLATIKSGEIEIGDVIPYESSLWTVKGLEYNLDTNGKIKQPIGIIVKKI